MAGLLGFTLADLSGAVDSRKRQYANLVRGLLSDPGMTLAQLAQMDAEQTQRDRATLGNSRSVMPEVRQQAQEQDLMNTANAGGLLGMIAYHGSPHKFDKFDMSKIGTGEGAQAYGHGLYFAENQGVAKQYAGMSSGHLPKATDTAHVAAAQDFIKHGMDPHAGLKSAYPGIKATEIEGAVAEARGGYKPNLYKVDIPDDAVAKMLDWDKPLSQQPESVRKALEPIIAPLRKEAAKNVGEWGDLGKAYNIDNELTGQQIVELMRTKIPSVSNIIGGGGPVVTNKLRDLGIPGIRYLDAGSRGKGGTSNFVLFDDQLAKIVGRE